MAAAVPYLDAVRIGSVREEKKMKETTGSDAADLVGGDPCLSISLAPSPRSVPARHLEICSLQTHSMW